ncbi:hypothetical protein K1719_040440 [Acacia pycnantha]|nr:hypothetical protein K1719_040440 [Acacia pycnantha]
MGLEYYPSGSVVDGLSAALLERCQILKIKGVLCVSWPEFDASVVSLMKGLVQRDVLPGLDLNLSDEKCIEQGISSLSHEKHPQVAAT